MVDVPHKYKQLQLEAATDLEAIVILYDEAICRLKAAGDSFSRDKSSPQFKENIEFARKVIKGLSLILDFKQGGEIARNLYSLYDYMDKRLVVANEGIRLTPQYLDEIIRLLSKLRDSWSELARKEKASAYMPSGPQPQESAAVKHLELSI